MTCMDLEKKIGILLIAIGICIPLCTIPYLSGYSKDKGIFGNLYGLAIEIGADNRPPPINLSPSKNRTAKAPIFQGSNPGGYPSGSSWLSR